MNRTKFLRAECQHCRGHIEFPADSIGLTTDCPHCGNQTELLLAPPKEQPTIPRATIIYTVIAVFILCAGLVGAIIALKMAQRKITHKEDTTIAQIPPTLTNATPVPDDPIVLAGFRIGPVAIEKTTGTSLRHAVGTLTDTSGRQRFGVQIQFDLLDENGKRIDSTKDYQQVMEPSGEWKFRAPIMSSKATAAKATSVTEQK